MADVTIRPFVRHLRSDPTSWIRHLRRGAVVHEGTGTAFWFRPLPASISEVPMDDREQPLLFHARTSDFTDVTVQATLGYRITDPERAAARLDFSIETVHGRWRSAPLDQLGGVLTELAQQQVLGLIASLTLEQVLATGLTATRERIATGLAADARLADLGVTVTDVRVVAVRAEPDIERALATRTREQTQSQADRATYERRTQAAAADQELARAEMTGKVELARREADLVEQRGANDRRAATERAAADRITAEGEAERTRLEAEARAEAKRATGEADAEANRAWYASYEGADAELVRSLTLRTLAKNLPRIESVTVTPDMLTQLMERFAGGNHVGGNAEPNGNGPA